MFEGPTMLLTFGKRVWHRTALIALVRGGLGGWILICGSVRGQNWVQWTTEQGGNNHYYALTPVATNWTASQALAVSWGGKLASITSAEEQKFINNTFLTGSFEHLPLWIGLMAPPTKPPFKKKLGSLEIQFGKGTTPKFGWVTGEPFVYSNWKPGEPSNTPPGENYVAINWEYSDEPPRGAKGDWNDTPANGTKGYGGKTDGPYYGLVERASEPGKPATLPLAKGKFPERLVLGAGLLLVLLVVALRFRRTPSEELK